MLVKLKRYRWLLDVVAVTVCIILLVRLAYREIAKMLIDRFGALPLGAFAIVVGALILIAGAFVYLGFALNRE